MSLEALLLPNSATPSNFHPADHGRPITGDVFHIAERMKEISPDLYIRELEPEDVRADGLTYVIQEHCRDGVLRFVMRVDALDNRLLEKLRYLMARPLNERMDELERMEFKMEAERKEQELDELYERIGRPMWTELERCGFTQRGVSYPKRGIRK